MKTKTHPRIIVVNDEIFRLTENRYQKLLRFNPMPSDTDYEQKHDERCEYAKRNGKKLETIDLILRND